MITHIDADRIQVLNDITVQTGEYVVYWMQSSHRVVDNPSLQYAISRANQLHLPLLVYFGLQGTYPEANLRHFQFMLEGLTHVSQSLEAMGIKFLLRIESPDEGVLSLAKKAAILVVDRGYLKIHRSWYHHVAERSRCPFIQVEGNVVVPVEIASGKEEYSAATFRPKITRQIQRFLHPIETTNPKVPSLSQDLPTLAGEPVGVILSQLTIDRTISVSAGLRGGTLEANRRFERFLKERFERFTDERNDPSRKSTSGMSPYLHFGQVSPVALALRAQEWGGEGVDAFLEELIVRRELAVNFVHYNELYDGFSGLPIWAQKMLTLHTADHRDYIYTREELERAQTHDPYWNAAQAEVVQTGTMHGYMRMYWGKKILEWNPIPQDAYLTALYLNNKYEIDGRDPSGYAGVAWCFGKHDRPWKERSIFGTVRYMSAHGLQRKFAMDRYVNEFK